MKFRRHFILFLLVVAAAVQRVEALNFLTNTITVVGTGPTQVAVADVNGDGKPDLICANYNGGSGNTLTVLTNNGSTVFGSNATITVSGGVTVVVAADLNGDGKPDLVCNDNNNTLTVLTNDGAGLFVLNTTLTTGGGGSFPADVTAVDINGDGRPDLVCVNYLVNTLAVFTNSVTGLHPNATYGTGNNPLWVVAADVNGDGKPDLISANYGAGTLTVLTNNGSGTFSFKATVSAGSSPRRVTAADVNGDGKPDLIVANYNTRQLTVLTNNGTGSFGLNATLTVDVGGAGDVVMADLNGDGRPDLISANNASNTVTVLTNSSSTGAFGYNATVNLSAAICQPSCIVTADLNGDGKLDLVTANYNNNTLSVLMNTNAFPAPRLTITRSGGNPVVSWPAWNGGYILQTNGNLTANTWVTYGGALGYDGLKNNVTNPSPKNLFFRLMH